MIVRQRERADVTMTREFSDDGDDDDGDDDNDVADGCCDDHDEDYGNAAMTLIIMVSTGHDLVQRWWS